MEILNIGKWKLKCDVEATRKAFSYIPIGLPELCCDECSNFTAVRDRAFPPEALAIFELLGIDYHKESELWHTHRDDSGLHHYVGFFHFIGSIESGEEVKFNNVVGIYNLESIGNCFEYGFTSDAKMIPESFTGREVTQLEFFTRVPWIVDAPESD